MKNHHANSLRRHIALALMLCTLMATSRAAHAQRGGASWLLQYDGKSTNDLIWNKRFRSFLNSHLQPASYKFWGDTQQDLSQAASQFLGGPPDNIRVIDSRYVIASACVAHDCPERGLLWVDTKTSAVVFAPSTWIKDSGFGDKERYHLWLFANPAIDPAQLPPSLLNGIEQWSAQVNGDGKSHSTISTVTLVSPDGKTTQLTPAAVHAWQPLAQQQ